MKTIFLSAIVATLSLPAYANDYEGAMRTYLEAEIMPWVQHSVLTDAIRAQNERTAGYDQAMITELDQTWRAEVGQAETPTITPVVSNEAAEFLRGRVQQSNGAITEAFIMDAQGLNVAASSVTSDYWQGDEDKHAMTFAQGPGALHFSDIELDESTQTYQGQISIAITDPANGSVIGAMTIGVDAEALM